MASYKTHLTVWDSIEDDILEAMRGIKQLDGYNHTVREVVSWGVDDFPFRGIWPAIGVVIGSEELADTAGISMRRCRRDVGIEMWVPAPGGGKANVPTLSREYQKIVADIEKALYVDHTRGGNAEDTDILERSPAMDSGKRLIGAAVRCQVVYRHQVGDLYTKM